MNKFLEYLKLHSIQTTKLTMVLVAGILFVLAASAYATNQRLKEQQALTAQRQVANHTQTLNEIEGVVTQIEKNNQVNHDTTIKYLECVVQGLLNSTPTTAQSKFNACLAVSGVQPSD